MYWISNFKKNKKNDKNNASGYYMDFKEFFKLCTCL